MNELSMENRQYFVNRKINSKARIGSAICGLVMLAGIPQANASYIIQPDSVTTTTGQASSAYDIGNIIDQSGLLTPYTSGVTDFDTYTAFTTHTWEPVDNEWWTNFLTTGGEVVFDLGQIYSVDGFAFWNEDWAGIESVEMFISVGGGGVFTSLGSFLLTDNDYESNYLATVYKFSSVDAQYIKFILTTDTTIVDGLSPEVTLDGYPTNSIGEVAFSGTNPVPEPTTLLLFGVGAAGLLGVRKKK